jgi:acyl-CoA synthetase (NDP forming)
VGATDASRWSWNTFENWRAYCGSLPCYLVHPRHRSVHGCPAYPSLSAIGEPVDLVYVMVPTDQVMPVLEEAASLGVRSAVVLTAGFAETGPAGEALEARMVALAERSGMTILGPNGNGFINATGRRTPYGLPIPPPLRAGPVGIVLQSGGLASVVVAMAQARGIGVSLVVSTGNEAMVGATDVLSYLVDHEPTTAVAMFLEAVRKPEAFREVARRALEAGKPVVALAVGRTPAGGRAALAHTGAVVGDAAVVRGVLEDLGVVLVDSLEDLLATAGLLASRPGRLGRRLGVVANSGGACDVLADRATDEGLELPEFPDATIQALRGLLPPYANPHNPLDVTGYVIVDPGISLRSLEVVLEGAPGRFDQVLYQVTIPRVAPPDPAPLLARFEALSRLVRASEVPVVLQSPAGPAAGGFANEVLDRHGFFVLDGIEHGMRALGSALRWQERRARALARARRALAPLLQTPDGAEGAFGERRARALLARHGVPVVPTTVVQGVDEAVAAARELGWPVVLKLAADGLAHKSDLGGVELDLRSPQEVAAGAGRLLGLAEELGVRSEGLQVAPMRRGGVELLVSVRVDPSWGPVLVLGIGGVLVEVLGDTVLCPLPVDAHDVDEALRRLRGHALLEGTRGRRPPDRHALVQAILAIASVGEGLRAVLDTLEVNPLWAGPEGAEALDALVVWRAGGAPAGTGGGGEQARTGDGHERR